MLLSYLERKEIDEYLIKGYSYSKIIEVLNRSKNAISQANKRLNSDIIKIHSNDPIYDSNVQMVLGEIEKYMNIQVKSINNKQPKKLKVKDIYHILNKKNISISLNKTKELFKYQKNLMGNIHLHRFHLPGEYVEFDYGQLKLNLKGIDTNIDFAVYTMPYSLYDFIYVSLKQDGKAFANSLNAFIKHMGKVPPMIVFDNLSIGIQHRTKTKNKVITKLFKDLSNHYDFTAYFCTPYRPQEKSHVELSVKRIKNEFKKYNISSFNSIDEIQEFVNSRVLHNNLKPHPIKNDTRINLLQHELPKYHKNLKKPFVYYHEKRRTASSQCLISLDGSKYEVPQSYRNMRLLVKYTDHDLYIIGPNGEVAAHHILSKHKGTKRLRIWYFYRKLRRSPNKFKYTKEYLSLPKWLKLIFEHSFKSNTEAFYIFIKFFKKKPKDIIKKYMRRKNKTYSQLTKEELLIHIL